MATVDIILKSKIENLGAEADVVSVRRGYARNFLIPKGRALEATKANMTQLQNLKRVRAERESKELDEAQRVAGKINKLRLKLTLSVGQGGKAFGSVTTQDLVKAIAEKAKGLEIDRHQIELEKPIKGTGKYEIPVKVHPEIKAKLRIEVVAETEGEESKEA